ncbi:unnamed protein product [Adineta ricciae]|uniref:Uncharacterized protein n=1 Tax=Adineta ricciae TaxID=249248 RepID=A0A816HI27_ADIRI|nr:unnamed protein product [Adineta ricciae]
MLLHMIVDYLQDGVRDALKIHIKRRMKTLPDTPSPVQFLTIACDEEELQQELLPSEASTITAVQPYFPHFTTATNTFTLRPDYSPRHSYSNNQSSYSTHPINPSTSSSSRSGFSQNQFSPCLICNRSTHRTINCYYKYSSGCYKCDASDHVVHEYPQVFQ